MEPKLNEFLESLIQHLLSDKDESDDLILLDASTVCYTEQPMLLSPEEIEKEKEILRYSHSLLNNNVEEEGVLPDKDINNEMVGRLCTLPNASAPASDEPLPLPLPLPLQMMLPPDEEGFELPAGFRFSPSNKQLLLHYLTNRLSGRNLSSNEVKDFDVYTKEPWLLPGANKKECVYFFVPWRKTSKDSCKAERSAGKGFWRASTGDKDVRDNQKKLIGYLKQLTYHINYNDNNNNNQQQESNNIKSKKMDWIMHEYKLTKSPEMTLCRIKYKTPSSTKSRPAK
ncbi:NAC domain-containing protein 83-like [Macadamia integrifolia]|uniref:NAC domain-containing protein 83-like n=1 Tax=Macadamia integrifolia TaxID=60698 RepID=UPI001C533581|nr:NAC domain-containing protein 83-like [Macadamia integrifolia]